MKALMFVASLLLVLLPSTSAWAQGSCGKPPGERYELLNWRLLKGGTLPQIYAFYLLEDFVRLTIEDGKAFELRDDEVLVVLEANHDMWKKQIKAWGCGGAGETIMTEGRDMGPKSMRLARGDGSARIDTIVLSKGEFGVGMTDKYHLDPDYFFQIYGGKVVKFLWVKDWPWEGAPHGPCSYTAAGGWCIPLGSNPGGGLFFSGGGTDIVVWSGGLWGNERDAHTGGFAQWGQPGDVPVPFDYDFDGRFDLAVWRWTTGEWWILDSFTGVGRVDKVDDPVPGDEPVPGDYDADGKADLAIWRPAARRWLVKSFATGEVTSHPLTQFQPGDIPVPGDYDGDGATDFAVWRPSTGDWLVVNSSDGRHVVTRWGEPGDVPVPGQYLERDKLTFAVWRPRNGRFLKHPNGDGGDEPILLGFEPGDVPVPGDYSGDGLTDVALWRPWTGVWRILSSGGDVPLGARWGGKGDIPVPGGPASRILIPSPATLAVSHDGNGTGSVTISPAGVPCGTECFDYLPGSIVRLTGTAASGSRFLGFFGGGCTGTGPCDVAVTVNTAMLARFCGLPCLTLSYDGKIADRVGRGDSALAPDGTLDATLTLRSTQGFGGSRTITSLSLHRAALNTWDTTPNVHWILGVVRTDGSLVNTPNGAVNFSLRDGESVILFAADPGNVFRPGTSLSLTVTFADGTTGTVTTTVP